MNIPCMIYVLAIVVLNLCGDSFVQSEFSQECKNDNLTLYDEKRDYYACYRRYQGLNSDCLNKLLFTAPFSSKSEGLCEKGLKTLKNGCVDIAKEKLCAVTVSWGDDEDHERFIFECVPNSCIENDEDELHSYFLDKIAKKCNQRDDCKVNIECDNVLVLPKGGIPIIIFTTLVCAFAAWFVYNNRENTQPINPQLQESLMDGENDEPLNEFEEDGDNEFGNYDDDLQQQQEDEFISDENANNGENQHLSSQADQFVPIPLERS